MLIFFFSRLAWAAALMPAALPPMTTNFSCVMMYLLLSFRVIEETPPIYVTDPFFFRQANDILPIYDTQKDRLAMG